MVLRARFLSHVAARLVAQRGLTLVELGVTLTVVALVALAAWPALSDLLQRRALVGLAAELRADLQRARSEAVARRQGVRMEVQAVDGGSCWLAWAGASGACRCTGTAEPACDGGAVLVSHRFVEARTGLAVSASVAALRFDPRLGTATPSGTLRIATAGGAAVHHVVNLTGRVRSCSVGGALAGVPEC